MRTVIHSLAIIAAVLAAQTALGQAPPANLIDLQQAVALGKPAQTNRQRFDLDFPGGGPKALVAAIEKATGKPLNAIVPTEEREVQIPPMKLTKITVQDLSDALRMVSTKQEFDGANYRTTWYAFETGGNGEDAVWGFRRVNATTARDVCRFYQLGEYLEKFTIEDITTAIQTGWELLGVKPAPRLKFHPETKLLIAVGQEYQLQTIEDVLQQLRKALPNAGRHLMPGIGPPSRIMPTPAPGLKKDGASTN